MSSRSPVTVTVLSGHASTAVAGVIDTIASQVSGSALTVMGSGHVITGGVLSVTVTV